MRLGRAGVAAGVVLAALAVGNLGADGTGPVGPDCAGATVRLSPLYASNVPGPGSPQLATTALLGAADTTIDLGVGSLTHDVVEQRGDTAIVAVRDSRALRALALTAEHPAGGWMVDELLTCTTVPRP